MQNNNYQRKQPRGSCPPIEEIEKGFNEWVSGLRPIEQTPQNSLGKDRKWVLSTEGSGPVMQPYEEGRWKVDAREGG